MSTIIIPGACDSLYNAGDAILNYGTDVVSPSPFANYPIYFTLPYDGFMQSASISLEQAQPSISYTLRNLDTAQEYTNLLSMTSPTKQVTEWYTINQTPFLAGERLLWYSNDNATFADASTVLTTICKLNTVNIEFMAITGSFDNGFLQFPYSFGSGGGLITGLSTQIRVPFDCSVRAISLTANESGNPITVPLTLDVLANGVSQQQITMGIGNTSAYEVYGGAPNLINSGEIISIENLTPSVPLNRSVIIILLEKL